MTMNTETKDLDSMDAPSGITYLGSINIQSMDEANDYLISQARALRIVIEHGALDEGAEFFEEQGKKDTYVLTEVLDYLNYG